MVATAGELMASGVIPRYKHTKILKTYVSVSSAPIGSATCSVLAFIILVVQLCQTLSGFVHLLLAQFFVSFSDTLKDQHLHQHINN